jgi:single-strand DNA-binding protein
MNRVVLVGRLTKDPEMRTTTSGISQTRFTIAVNRRTANQNGQREADFISCVAFGKNGEFVEKYLHQGTKICIEGRIQTGSYTKQDGTKVYTTEVIAEKVDFVDKKNESTLEARVEMNDAPHLEEIGENEELPF